MKVKELQKELLNNKTNKLIKFIGKEFYYLNSDNISKIRNNINTLKKIDNDILNYVIAKLDSQKSDFESMPIVLVVWTLLITIVVSLIEVVSNIVEFPIGLFWFFMLLIFVVSAMNIIVTIEQKRNKVIVFFISLLKEVRED